MANEIWDRQAVQLTGNNNTGDTTPEWADTVPGIGAARNIPGDRELWSIGGQLYLVWMVPVDSDGDGVFDERFPIAFSATPKDLANAGLSATPTKTISLKKWNKLGGLNAGNMLDLNNTERHPFEYFVEELTRQADLYPWLLDPEIMAVTAAAWLRGEVATEDDYARTEWWKTHTEAERAWMSLVLRDPATAEQRIESSRITVLRMLEGAGVNNAPSDLINLMATKFVTGAWDDVYLTNQVAILADPSKRGSLDTAIQDYLASGSVSLDTTMGYRQEVRELVHKWLGPVYGNWTDKQIDDWAGRIRNDPDAQTRLTELLSKQRLALFPSYTDPMATYQDIAGPWKSVVNQVWGSIPDESDPFFTEIVRINDLGTAQKMLRKEGLVRGNKKVGQTAMRALYDSMGGQVVRMQ